MARATSAVVGADSKSTFNLTDEAISADCEETLVCAEKDSCEGPKKRRKVGLVGFPGA
jgi:hypothetical protein